MGGTRRGDLRRYAEMPEDPLDHGRLFDERDQAQTAAAPRTGQHIKPERACHQRRPTLTAGLTPRRLGGISLTGLFESPTPHGSCDSSGIFRISSRARRALPSPPSSLSLELDTAKVFVQPIEDLANQIRASLHADMAAVVPLEHFDLRAQCVEQRPLANLVRNDEIVATV